MCETRIAWRRSAAFAAARASAAADSMTDAHPHDPPSPFVEAWVAKLAEPRPAARRALDVAMGRGRHSVVLAAAGLRVFGVDRQLDVVREARVRVRAAGYDVASWCADLTTTALPIARFDLVVVTRYLQRDLFPSLVAALAPGGAILYETFTEAQRERGRGPTSPDHLLQAGELPRYFRDLDVLFYEEVLEPDAVAHIVARRLI